MATEKGKGSISVGFGICLFFVPRSLGVQWLPYLLNPLHLLLQSRSETKRIFIPFWVCVRTFFFLIHGMTLVIKIHFVKEQTSFIDSQSVSLQLEVWALLITRSSSLKRGERSLLREVSRCPEGGFLLGMERMKRWSMDIHLQGVRLSEREQPQ